MAQGIEAGAAPANTLIDGRYHLDRTIRTRPGVELWCATDTVLDRRVAIQLVSGLNKSQAADLTAAASRAGLVPDARWVRVLDVGSEPLGKTVRVWVISEWVEGTTLAQAVQREPLRPPVAAALLTGCAQAVAAAARAGASHGGLHPGEVIIAADGQPRITGLEIHRALHEISSASQEVAGGPPRPDSSDLDVLGGLLYAALTGRWPLSGWAGLPAPRRGDGLHPRQQRRGVPRDLDEITATARSGGYADPDALARALAAVPHRLPSADAADRERPNQHRIRRVAWWVVPPTLVAAVGIAAWIAGSDLGKVPGADRTNPAVVAPHPVKSGKVGTKRVWTKPPAVTSFDPDGDGEEDPGGVGLAVDADPSTQWSTDIYHGNAHFGGLKPGVGLLIDLGRPKRVDAARLLLSAAGADLQLRAGDIVPHQASDLPVVGRADDAATTARITLTKPVTARYWLLWITSLPQSGTDDYSLGVPEVTLLR